MLPYGQGTRYPFVATDGRLAGHRSVRAVPAIRFSEMLDFHNHLMPGVDDGAASLDESRSGIATMLEQGITTIVTTPHIRGSLTAKAVALNQCNGSAEM